MKTLEFLAKRFAVVIALATLSLPARAADQTWTGGSDNQWTTTGNWSGSALPGATDTVTYNNFSTANLSNWLSLPFAIKGLVVSNVPGPVSINSASTLTFTNGINMANATQPLTIAAPVALSTNVMNANLSWNVVAGQTLSVPGVVSGSGGLYKDGFGTLYLSGTNTFTGAFTNNGGQVWINNSGSLGTGPKTISVANNLMGAGLHLNGTNGGINLAANLSFTVSQNQGTIFNEAGTNVINGNLSVFSGGGNPYIVANGGLLTLNGGISLGTTARPIQLGGPGVGVANGQITGAGMALRKTDGGTWTLNNNNNTYSGATTVEGGTLVLAATAKMGSTPSITVFNNATLDVSAVVTSSTNAFALTANQIVAGGGNVTGNVNASAAGVVIQPGGLNVPGTPGGMGAAGTLSVSGNLSMGPTTTNYFELNPATTPGGGINDLISVGGNLDPQNAYISIGTLNGLVNGTYRLFNYTGAKLSSFNPTCLTSLRGTFTIDENVANQINLVVSGVVNLVWRGTGSSSTWDLNTTADWNANTLTFLNGDSVTFDDTGVAPTVNLSGTLQPGSVTFNNSTVSYTLAVPTSGKITGPAGLTKSGSGTLTITAATSDFTGPVTINGGTLGVGSMALSGSASTLGAGTTVTLNGGTFQFTGARPAAGVVNRLWTLGPNGGTVQSTTATFFMANTISGAGSLTKSGSQQLILGDLTAGLLTAANNSYAGNTYITQGDVQIRNAHALGSGKVVITAGADLSVGGGANYGTVPNDIDLNGYDTSGLGAIRIGDASTGINFGGTITLLGNSSVGSSASGSALTFSISGPIVGSGSLTKLQSIAFTCTLGGTNTYTGNTIITGGTLAVGLGGVGAISNSPNISVGSAAKLQLNAGASLGSSVNISLAAGGYLDVNGLGAGTTYTLGSGATLNASGTGTASGTTQAEIHGSVGGTVSLGARPISLTFTPTIFTGDTTHPALVISQGTLLLSGNVITVNNAAGTALGVGTYRLIQVGNGTTGTTSGTPNATPFITGKGLAAGNTATLSVSSGNVILTVSTTSPTATTTTLSSLTASPYGSSVTFTATVAPTPTGGTVQFYDNGVAIGSPVTVSGGTASYSTSMLWAGSHPITAAYSGASGSAASATASASTQTVNAVALSITANADSKTYGQTKAYGSGSTAFTSTGLLNGDTIASVTITASGGTAANAPVASYNLTPGAAVGGAFNANNYTITYNNGTLTVNPAPLSITANPDSKTYGQTKAYGAGSTAFTSSGLQNGETIGSVTLTDGSGGGLAAAAAGTYPLTPGAATGGTFTAGNYSITYHSGTLTVGAAALDVTANNATKECSQSLTFAGTESTTGAGQLVNGNTVTNVTLTSSGAGSGVPTGSYDIVPSAAVGSGLTNYSITYHKGTLTVSDTTPPVIVYYFTNLTLSTTSSNCQGVLPDLTGTNYIIAVDGCSSSVTVTQNPPANTFLSQGTNEVVLTAFDASGNATNSTNTVVVADLAAPVITLLGANPLTLECHASFTDPGATALDGCVGTVSVITSGSVDANTPGTYNLTYTADDGNGNTNSAARTVNVQDTTPPAIVYYFTNLTLSTTSSNCQAVMPDLTGTNYIIAVDSCSSSVTVTQNPPANTFLSVGTNEVVLTAFDPSGNAMNSTNAVIVADLTPPVITCPANISVVTTDPTGVNVSFTVAATDNCDPSPTIICTPATGSFFLAGTNTVTCYAYDVSGNTNTCSFLVMVDRAPIVDANVSAYPLENQLLTLYLAKLLAVVSDPDNDPLSVVAAGPTSTNGGTVTLTSTSVTYQPVANFVGADLFSYVISDGRGGLATNTVAVTVASSNGLSPNVVYGPVVSNGQFIVRFAGIPGYTYTVEATDDLGSPAWTKKVNLTAPVTNQGLGIGIFEFSESVGAATSRFYRTVYPSY